jgi:hypothetical protein
MRIKSFMLILIVESTLKVCRSNSDTPCTFFIDFEKFLDWFTTIVHVVLAQWEAMINFFTLDHVTKVPDIRIYQNEHNILLKLVKLTMY